MNTLAATDLTILDDEPRVLDLRLAEALELERPTNIRQVIERNADELLRYGTLHRDDAKSSGGRPGTAYYLNEAQAILICMRSDAPRAADVRAEIIAVFQAFRHGRLAPHAPVSAELIGSIFETKLIPVRHDIRQMGERIERIDTNVVFLSGRIDDIVPRREFAAWIKRQWYEVVVGRYACDCPCCRDAKIIDADGNPTDQLQHDHFAGRELNGVEDGWPVCERCNSRLRAEPEFKVGRRSHFDVFQDNRRSLFGRAKSRKGIVPGQMRFRLTD